MLTVVAEISVLFLTLSREQIDLHQGYHNQYCT